MSKKTRIHLVIGMMNIGKWGGGKGDFKVSNLGIQWEPKGKEPVCIMQIGRKGSLLGKRTRNWLLILKSGRLH